jgi:O-succinylbenzoic acid--CoA ligase
MDASLLTSSEFWEQSQPVGRGSIPEHPALLGHVLFETSGSSGAPKSVALSKRALLTSAAAVNQHLGVTCASRWGLALPLHHVGGFGVAARAYQAGCALDAFSLRWEAAAFARWLADGEVSHTSLVPTQVHDLVRAALTAPTTLRAIVVGGGHLDPATGQAARDLGWPILASYGMTEAGSQIATQPLDGLDQPYQSSPLPLLPIWTGRTGADQALIISGPALFSGYVIDGVFQPLAGAEFVTADRVDLQGRALTPLGRADTQIKILGELVDPEAVERELIRLSHGKIHAGTMAVIAIPDERAGYLLVPFFESSIPQEVVDSTLAAYQANAPGYKRLKPAIRMDTLPRSELGKLRRASLRDSFIPNNF